MLGIFGESRTEHHTGFSPWVSILEAYDTRYDLTVTADVLVNEMKAIEVTPDVGPSAGD
jgi:hypothetical protein